MAWRTTAATSMWAHICRSDSRTLQRTVWLLIVGGVLASPAEAARLYVSNEDGHSVTVIDADSAAVIATIPVGKRPRGMKQGVCPWVGAIGGSITAAEAT